MGGLLCGLPSLEIKADSSHDGSDLPAVLEVNIDKSILPTEPSRSYQMWSEIHLDDDHHG